MHRGRPAHSFSSGFIGQRLLLDFLRAHDRTGPQWIEPSEWPEYQDSRRLDRIVSATSAPPTSSRNRPDTSRPRTSLPVEANGPLSDGPLPGVVAPGCPGVVEVTPGAGVVLEELLVVVGELLLEVALDELVALLEVALDDVALDDVGLDDVALDELLLDVGLVDVLLV